MSSYKANIRVMYVFSFLLSLHFVSGVLVPFYLEWGKITFTQIMILQAVFVFSIFLLEIPTGAVADYFGRKTSLILAAITTAAGALIYVITPNFYMFILAEIIWATGCALLSGADQALIYDSLKKIKSEKQSKKIFGRIASIDLIALIICAPIGSLIAATWGLRYTMMVMVVPFLLAFLVAFSFKEPKTKQKIESRRYLDTLTSGIKYFKGHRILKILAFDTISISTLVFLAFWIYQPLLTQLGVPLAYFGFLYAAFTGIQVIFMNRFETLEKLFRSKKNYLLWSAIIAGIAFIGLGINYNIPLTIILILIISGFGLSRAVLFESYMNKYIESHNRATVLSSISMINRFVKGILYLLVGLSIEWSLNYTAIIIGVLIVIFALLSRVKEEHLID